MDWSFIGILIAVSIAGVEAVEYAYNRYTKTERRDSRDISEIDTQVQRIYQFMFGMEEADGRGHVNEMDDKIDTVRNQLDRIEDNIEENSEAIRRESVERKKEHEKLVEMVEELGDKVDTNTG